MGDAFEDFDWTGMDMHNAFTGQTAADASRQASDAQLQGTREGIAAQREFLNTIRGDLSPFVQFGAGQLDGLSSLISNPNAQLNFVQNNPFFNALAGDATNRLMNIQAASGRLGTGDTPAALQNQLLLLGNSLVQQSIGNRMNAATMGQNAAAMTGTATQNTGNMITDLITGGANARASGIVGAANAQSQGAANMASLAGTIGGIFLSDRRMKCDLEHIGTLDCGIPVYSFRYVTSPQRVVGVMAQDVEPIVPGAVLRVFDVMFVDYSELKRVLH